MSERSKQGFSGMTVGQAKSALLKAVKNGQLVKQKLLMNTLEELGMTDCELVRLYKRCTRI